MLLLSQAFVPGISSATDQQVILQDPSGMIFIDRGDGFTIVNNNSIVLPGGRVLYAAAIGIKKKSVPKAKDIEKPPEATSPAQGTKVVEQQVSAESKQASVAKKAVSGSAITIGLGIAAALAAVGGGGGGGNSSTSQH